LTGRTAFIELEVCGVILIRGAVAGAGTEESMTLRLSSPAFTDGGRIPVKYTCEGEDVSPPLAWEGAPEGAKSFVLIVDDPDAPDPKAPKMVWVHWVVVNLPPGVEHLPENASKRGLPAGCVQGVNDAKQTHYHGPCPPVGEHRYFFKLYALDAALSFARPPTKNQALQAMEGHVLAQAELMGVYSKR
jgi:Raf kinase inhibitor-like YbhB/YbcL family protein